MKRMGLAVMLVMVATTVWGEEIRIDYLRGKWSVNTGEIWEFNRLGHYDNKIIGMGYTYEVYMSIQTNDGKTYLNIQWDTYDEERYDSSYYGYNMYIYEIRSLNASNLTLVPFMRINNSFHLLKAYFLNDTPIILTKQ